MATITGDGSDEFIIGTGESDLIEAMGGNDTVIGNNNYSDRLYGGLGNDSLVGDQSDLVYGDEGNDSLSATMGSPLLYGGIGNDVIYLYGSFFPGSGIAGQAYGGDGDDGVILTAPVGGHVEGGLGDDLISVATTSNFGDATGGSINFTTGVFTGPGALALTFSGFERGFFQGNLGADTVIGGANADTAYLYQGDNVADMGAGNDTVAARYGWTQTLEGGADDDLLILQDALFSVYFIVDGLDGSVDDGQLSTITGFDRYEILGSQMNDIISLGAGNDTMTGWRGDDTLYGMSGDDSMRGQGGSDSLYGGQGNDRLLGGAGSDTLYAEEGNDILGLLHGTDTGYGGAGHDRLFFGAGTQTGWGEAGRDSFVFRIVDDTYDWIGDFTSGEDRIQVASTALVGAPGPGGAVVLSQGSMSGTNAQFLFYHQGTQGYLFWDPDGTGALDAQLLFVSLSAATINAGDIAFIL